MSSVIAANSWNSRNSSREHNISQHHTDTDTDSTDSTFFTRSLLKNGKGRSKVVVEGPFEDILKVYRCYLLCCVRHDRWDFHTANNHHRTEVGRRLRCSNTVTLMSCWGQTEPVLCYMKIAWNTAVIFMRGFTLKYQETWVSCKYEIVKLYLILRLFQLGLSN